MTDNVRKAVKILRWIDKKGYLSPVASRELKIAIELLVKTSQAKR